MSKRTLSLVLLMVLLPVVGQTADPPPPREATPRAETSEPAKPRVDPRVEPPRPKADRAVTPEVLHPARNAAFTEGTAAMTVRVRDLPPFEKTDRQSGGTQSHVQGSFLQYELPRKSDRLPGRRGIAANPPTAAPLGEREKTPGDNVVQFQGQRETGWIPPDTVVAVGPRHVLEATNSHFTVYSKLGNVKQTQRSFNTFFGGLLPAGWNGLLFDPRVLYSVEHGQFVMMVLGRDDTNQEAYAFVAVSQTADPSDQWWVWRFTQSAANPDDADSWWDYASLGADSWGIYMTGNYFRWVGGFKHAIIWSLNPDMFNGGASSGWRFWGLTWPSGSLAASLQAMLPHSIAGGQETFFANTFSGSGSDLCVWTLTGDRTNAPGLTRATVPMQTYNAIGENVGQPGARPLDGGDARVLNGVYSHRSVYVTLTSDVFDDTNQAGAIVTKANVDTNTNEWDWLLWTTDYFYFYPAISVAGSVAGGNIAAYMNWSSVVNNVFASGAVKVFDNHPTDGAGAFVSIATGAEEYVDLDTAGRNRWGDYSGAAYDWTCQHFWGAIEFADTGDAWRTMISSRVSALEPPCQLIDVTAPDGGEVFDAGDVTRVTWDDLNVDPTTQTYVFYFDGANFHQQSGPISPTVNFFDWTVPAIPSTLGQIWVGAWDGAGYTATDFSDDVFTVRAPTACIEAVFGLLSELRIDMDFRRAMCLGTFASTADVLPAVPEPLSGEGYYYLSRDQCTGGSYGRTELDTAPQCP